MMNVANLAPVVASFFLFICGAMSESDPLVFSTKECVLDEPVQGYKFDFNTLHSDTAHQAKSDKGDIFDFNFCGNLTRNCANESNVAACLKKGDKEYVLGRQHELHYSNGRMSFNYTGGENCTNGTGKFQLHVILDCDYTLDPSQTHVISYADGDCSYYIKYETPFACLPEPESTKSNNCSVRDAQTGHTFDLISLSDVNYRTTDRQGNFFVLNVCKPVLYGMNAMCPAGSSICFYQPKIADYKKRFLDYGTAQSKPVFENGVLQIRHTSPTSCNATMNYTSIISFHCDKFVKNAHPEFVGLHGCTYEFTFVTPLACNDLPPCTTVTHGNEILDLSPLGKLAPVNLSKNNIDYTFAVCAKAGKPCFENNGACLTQNGIQMSLGNANTHLRFNQSGSPYLLYTDGGPCTTSKDNTYWSTKIEFVCANNATKDNGTGDSAKSSAMHATKIIEDSNCQLLIQYQTPLACQEQIKCQAKANVEHSEDGTGEELVDLTPLISATSNYEAKVDMPKSGKQQVSKTTKFYLNVCRPLVPVYQLGCAGGSAACMADGATGAPELEHSLGFPLASLVAINRTAAELRYLGGDPCPSDNTTQLSARIEFNCDMAAGRGSPVLRGIDDDCHYRFVWPTSVICPPHMCSYNEDTCEIKQDELNLVYSLRNASYAKDGKVSITHNNKSFDLNLCGPYRKPVTDYSQGTVNIFFSEKGPCVDGTVNVQMRLICSNEMETVATFSDDAQCNLLYEQRTSDICSFLGLEVPSKKPQTTVKPQVTTTAPESGKASNDKQQSEQIVAPAPNAGSIGAILAAILSLTAVVACVGVIAFSPERRGRLLRIFRRSSSAVRSNEEANLLLEPNGEFTDSDDDMLL